MGDALLGDTLALDAAIDLGPARAQREIEERKIPLLDLRGFPLARGARESM